MSKRPNQGDPASESPKAPVGKKRLARKRVDRREGANAEPIIAATTADADGPMRIAKAMARAGLCSRREAERWIADGRVSVNGRLLKTPAFEVARTDTILVDGKPLPSAEPARLWRYHKPRGLVTTHADPQGRATVFEKMPPEMPRVVSIGRLDFNTEGLLLLTNDGDLARYLELPKTGWLRRYRVRAMGRVSQAELDALKAGVMVEGVAYGPVEATIDSVQAANMWLTIAIREGKNREVRKILTHLGLTVNRLIRVSFGPFQLLDLAPGAVEVVKRRQLAEQLGVQVAQELGLSESTDDRKARHARGKALGSQRSNDDSDDDSRSAKSMRPKPATGGASAPTPRPKKHSSETQRPKRPWGKKTQTSEPGREHAPGAKPPHRSKTRDDAKRSPSRDSRPERSGRDGGSSHGRGVPRGRNAGGSAARTRTKPR